jgi:hypothetical protein
MAKEPKERVARRVRVFRKRYGEALKQHDAYIFELRQYFRSRGLTNEWAFAADVYLNAEIFNVSISFEQFVDAIRGNKEKDLAPVRSIEIGKVWLDDHAVLLIRPVHIPKKRNKKT